MTPGPQHRNAERGREEAPFHRPFHWLRSNTALLAFFFRLASASRSFKRENGLTNDGDESSSPSPLSLPLSSSFSAFCLHIVKHICLVLGCRAVVNPALDSSPSRAYNIYYKSLSRSFCHPSDSSPISLSYKLALLFSLLSSEFNPGRIRTAERRDKRISNILRLLAPNIASCRNFVKKPAWKCYEMMEALSRFIRG